MLLLFKEDRLSNPSDHRMIWEAMKQISYASAVSGLMYAQVCSRADIAHVSVLRRFLSNLGVDLWRIAKKVMRYLWTKDSMLVFSICDELDDIKSTFDYVFKLVGGAIS